MGRGGASPGLGVLAGPVSSPQRLCSLVRRISADTRHRRNHQPPSGLPGHRSCAQALTFPETAPDDRLGYRLPSSPSIHPLSDGSGTIRRKRKEMQVTVESGWALVDVETSGLRAREHRVPSVAAITMDSSGRVEEEFSTLLNPGW